ncbi:MAG: TonB-dependent receptor [Saprospiraceae bacterium]|nr:TonB-dependent receptor [Saprospiraceae bacterium]
MAQPPQYQRGGGQGPSITGKITGTLVDSVSGQPVEFATVVLIDAASDKEVDGTITEEKGEFKMQEVKLGKYLLRISFIGYRPKTVEGIELTPKSPDYQLETIELVPESFTLNEVTVTDQRSLVENKIDRLVYNADKDITSVGGDASDVLSRVPLLTVDPDGNVSLRGSSNIRILINDKPSTLFNGNVGEALKSLPADQIKTIEVITTPTAKYDGEGTAGIINIITKQKEIRGFTGSVSTTVGTRTNRGNVNLSAASGRFGINANISSWLTWPRGGNTSFLRQDDVGDGQQRILRQDGENETQSYGPRGSIGAFYDFNAYNSINSSVSFGAFGNDSESVTEVLFLDPVRNIDQDFTRLNTGNSLRGSFDWTSDYTRRFKDSEREFTAAVQVSGSKSDQENNFSQEGADDPSVLTSQRNQNEGLNLETTLQLDYVHPFGEAVKMETGAKAVLRRIDSDYTYEDFDFDSGSFIFDSDRSDNFDYNQDVTAGYLQFNVELGEHYGLIAGLRYEHTDIKGSFESNELSFANDYDNLLPSFIFSRKLPNFSNLKFSYTRRIQRPSLFFINPYVELNDPRNITFGNPDLAPETSDQFEIGYNTFIKGVSINTAVYYRRTTDIIESILDVNEEGISFTTYQNIGKNNSFGTNIYGSATIKKKFRIGGGVDIYSYNVRSTREGLDLSNQAILWNGRINGSLKLDKGFSVQFFGFYRAPRQTIQGSVTSFSLLSLGVEKEFSERMSLGLNAFEPFNNFKRFETDLAGDDFFQESVRNILFRSFGLNFSYRFGKLDFRQRERRSKIRNQDLKEGQGGEQMQ